MIKLYGLKMTSAYRCHLLASEIGLEYEEVGLDLSKSEQKSADYLKLNPNGKVPCLVDGDFVIWESMAINSYLAKKYKPELLGGSIEAKALIDQWSYWAVLELQPLIFTILRQMSMLSDEERDVGIIEEAKKELPAIHKVLDDHLADQAYILGAEFTLADINVGSVVIVNFMIKNDISEFANMGKWLQSLMQRPSFQ